MSELPRPAPSFPTHHKGPHYALIKQKIPLWLTTATPTRIASLSSAELSRPAWYASASPHQHEVLQRTNAEGWRTQNEVDRQLGEVQDVYAFAEPLLKKAIGDRYGLHLDVKTTFLNLFITKTLPWYTLNISPGVTSRKVSLLDAALHNFAAGETFEEDSCYISQPDYRGHFTIQPLHDKMTIAQFKALCRELDLGARYQQHLNSHLLPSAPTTRATLKHNIIASQKAALKVAAQLAALKTNGQQAPDLGAAAYGALMRALRGERGLMQFYQLSILDAQLTGILLIAADLDRMSGVSKVIAYIPHDPESPVKEYDSSLAFMRDLSRKLQTNAPIPSRDQQTYQQFFSQFVDHSLRGHFFAGLDQRLCQVQWHEKAPLDPRPHWRETPLDNPRLQFSAVRIDGDLWEHLYQQALNKILNDGRTLVVSTADADSAQRWAWWDNLTKIVADIFNIALMVVTPFVPFLGELMLAYQSGLKTRLNLPWVSEHMVYRNTAKVTQAQLDKAARTIRQMQHGDGLVNGLLEQPFWSDYLHDAYLQDFNAQGEQRDKAGSQLQELLELQQQWATGQLPAEAKARLREQLVALADELVIPYSVVLADQVLSDSTVLGLYEHIQHDYNELARRLTRQALTRLG